MPVELPHLGRADRTLEGVRKCILHAVWQAQGKGCAPGAIGVCIGGDRTVGLPAREGAAVPHAGRREPRAERLAELEAQIMTTVNTLGIGPDGVRRGACR